MNLPGHRLALSELEALGWTLIHSMWQLTAVALLAFCLLWLLRSRSADARYLTACVALMLMAACPIATFMTLRAQERLRDTTPNSIIIKPITMGTIDRSVWNDSTSGSGSEGADAGVLTRSSAAGSTLPTALAGVWLIGVALMSARLLGGWIRVKRLVQRDSAPAAAPLQDRADEIAHRLGVQRAVRLLVSSQVQVPAAAGWVRTAVLLPTGILTGWPPEQLEALIAHELAHIRRNDYLINLAQTAIEGLLFYHPAVWWLSRQIRTEREHCCDDLVVRVTNSPLTYARALTALEEFRGATFAAPLAPAANGSPLMPRIRRVLGLPSASTSSTSVGVVGAFGAALCIFIGMLAGIWTIQATAGRRPVQPHSAPTPTNSASIQPSPAPQPHPALHSGGVASEQNRSDGSAAGNTAGHTETDSADSDDSDRNASVISDQSDRASKSDEAKCSDDAQNSDDTADKPTQCKSVSAKDDSSGDSSNDSKDRSKDGSKVESSDCTQDASDTSNEPSTSNELSIVQTNIRVKELNDRIKIVSRRLALKELKLVERLKLAREVSQLGARLGEQASRFALKATDRALNSDHGVVHLSLHLTDDALRIAMKETDRTLQRSLQKVLLNLNVKDNSDPDEE